MRKILIVGAGASGLMAGCELLEQGYSVTILEASDRSGGRIHTLDRPFSFPMEAGAEFVHGKKPLTRSLLKQSQNKIQRLVGNHYQVWKGEIETGDLLENEWGELNRKLQGLRKDMNMGSFLKRYFSGQRYHLLRQRVRGFAEGFDAADIHRVSAMTLHEEWISTDEEQQYHVRSGYSGLIRYLEKKIIDGGGVILFSSLVVAISWSRQKAKATTTTGKAYDADRIIVTVPLGVLQNGTIRFTPGLPRHTRAFRQMGFGTVIKFLFEFKHAFWEDRKKFKKLAFLFSDAFVPTWWSQLPEKIPMLTGWKGGPSVAGVTATEEFYSKALTSLSYIFNCAVKEIEGELIHGHVTGWGTDPFVLGSYAYATVETSQALKFVRQPVEDTVYFAGEHMAKAQDTGTVEAALVSGKETARRVSNRQ